MTVVAEAIARVHREEWARVVATLARRFGDLDIAEEMAAEALFSDGPFLESKEFLIGFWIIEAPDLDVALELATGGSKACNRRVEVRPFL